MQSKRCSRCSVVNPASGFSKRRASRDGLQSACRECRSANGRAYYEANRKKIGTRRRAYRKTHQDEVNARERAYRESHREEINARSRAYYEANREEISAYSRAYSKIRREEIKAYHRAYRETNRKELTAIEQKRRSKMQSASREVATRNGEPWTPAEDRVVLTSDGTLLEIAITLGRTTASVAHRRRRLRHKVVAA